MSAQSRPEVNSLLFGCRVRDFDGLSLGVFSDVEMASEQGVFLFLGYSTKDEELLKAVTGKGVLDTIGAIQGLVSYHNVNTNKVWIDR